MLSVRPRTVTLVSVLLGLVATAAAEPNYTNTPAVQSRAVAHGATPETVEAEAPTSPLLAIAGNGSGGNTAWARSAPGLLQASSTKDASGESWHNSQGIALFVDHFDLRNPGLPANQTATFVFRFHLTGTMRILAGNPMSNALVNISIFAPHDDYAGQLNFSRVDGVPSLWAQSGGGTNPSDNAFAEADGSRRIYAQTSAVVDGYHVVHVAMPVTMSCRWIPLNMDPYEDNWDNRFQIQLSAISLQDSECDFSSTLRFADQNPIVPAPAANLPADGWTFDAASGEIALPAPLTVTTSTGTGEAGFVADQGAIDAPAALTLGDMPGGLSGGNFAHGWFGMDVVLDPGQTDLQLAITLPGAMGAGALWWWHDGAEWQSLALGDDDGDDHLVLQVTDGGAGDGDPAPGVIALAGGISDAAPVPNFVQGFRAAWRRGGVDLDWRAPAAAPERLRLTAAREDARWTVPLSADGRGGFIARDEAPALAAGGTVRYDLRHDSRLLESRTVVVPRAPAVRLGRVAPNPFNPRVEIEYSVGHGAGPVSLAIHDVRGRRVRVLLAGDPGVGTHRAQWDGRDARGRALPSGTYLVRIATRDEVRTRKLALVR